MKAILRTTGAFILLDTTAGSVIEQTVPHVALWTQFIAARVGANQIEVLETNLPDTADDAELQACLAEAGDDQLGIAAFVSIARGETEPEAGLEPAPAPAKRARKTSEA